MVGVEVVFKLVDVLVDVFLLVQKVVLAVLVDSLEFAWLFDDDKDSLDVSWDVIGGVVSENWTGREVANVSKVLCDVVWLNKVDEFVIARVVSIVEVDETSLFVDDELDSKILLVVVVDEFDGDWFVLGFDGVELACEVDWELDVRVPVPVPVAAITK